jgi:hypothetical protein
MDSVLRIHGRAQTDLYSPLNRIRCFWTRTMSMQNPLCGPKAPMKSWPASPASPSARQVPRPHNLCHEPLSYRTLESVGVCRRGPHSFALESWEVILQRSDASLVRRGSFVSFHALEWGANHPASGLKTYEVPATTTPRRSLSRHLRM